MNRISLVAVTLALAIGAIVAVGFGPGTVTADDGNETLDQLEDEANETLNDLNESGNFTAEDRPGSPIDEDVTLTSWTYEAGTFTLNFEHTGERPKTVTISEATQPGEGEQQFSIREERLLPGETTITMTTKVKGGESAVSITTADSIRDGHGVVVSTGEQGGEDPFAPFGGTSGVFSGVGLSILMSAAAAAWVLWREEKGVIKA